MKRRVLSFELCFVFEYIFLNGYKDTTGTYAAAIIYSDKQKFRTIGRIEIVGTVDEMR